MEDLRDTPQLNYFHPNDLSLAPVILGLAFYYHLILVFHRDSPCQTAFSFGVNRTFAWPALGVHFLSIPRREEMVQFVVCN